MEDLFVGVFLKANVSNPVPNKKVGRNHRRDAMHRFIEKLIKLYYEPNQYLTQIF